MRRLEHLSYLSLVFGALSGCYPQSVRAPEESSPVTVDVVQIQSETLAQTFHLLGETEPWREATAYFEVTGVVHQVFVEEGQLVQAGDRLAQLVLEDFELARSRAEAELEVVQARLDLLLAGTRKEDLEAARAESEQARVRASYWTGELSRNRELFGRGTVTASILEQVQREHDAAQQENRAARSRLDRAVAGPRKQELEAAQAEVRAKQQAHQLAERQLAKATLRAPFSGRVESRFLDEGAYINVFPTGGVPVVRIVNLDQVDAVVGVPDRLRKKIEFPGTIEITSAADPTVRAAARMIALSSLADPATGTYALRARADNSDRRFQGGMVVAAALAGDQTREVIRIPIAAVRKVYGRPPNVLLVDPRQREALRRNVELGAVSGNQIEVTAGLEPGDLLIVGGQHRVVPGDQVRLRAQTEQPAPP